MNGLRINSIAACALAPFAAIAWLATPAIVQAQRPPASPPPSAREAAPVDLTGQWVSVISEDWRWRMVTPLQIETDTGSQTRRLRFGIPPTTDEPRSRQGYSAANWEQPPRGAGAPEAFGIFSGRIGRDPQSLEVTTTNLLPGYYRKNGPPYSANTVLQEYFDYHQEANGDEWFTVTTIVTDPTYLDGVFITSSDFKKEQGTDGWNPTPCTVR
jgi:hypothetical protein